MQDVSPIIDEFLQNSKVGDMNPKEMISSAMKIANLLPNSSSEDVNNATLDSLANKFNELLNKNKSDIPEQNANMLKDSKDLFDEVIKNMKEKLQELQNKQNSNSLGFYA